MADKSFSPEERLFRIIQKGGQDSSGTNSGPGPKSRPPVSLALKAKVFFSQLNLKPAAGLSLKGLAEIDLRSVNKVLIFLVSLVTLVLVYYGLSQRPDLSRIAGVVSKLGQRPIIKRKIEPFKPAGFYLKVSSRRDIFKPLSLTKEDAAVFQSRSALDKLKEKVSGFKLRGIARTDIPKVMIENEAEGKVYFLRQGQMIGSSGIKVKIILKDKVRLSYQGEEIDLL